VGNEGGTVRSSALCGRGLPPSLVPTPPRRFSPRSHCTRDGPGDQTGSGRLASLHPARRSSTVEPVARPNVAVCRFRIAMESHAEILEGGRRKRVTDNLRELPRETTWNYQQPRNTIQIFSTVILTRSPACTPCPFRGHRC